MHIYTFLAKITKRSLKMTLLVCNPFQSTLRLNAFEISNTLTSSKTAHSLSPPAEASLYRREAGERKKESARGTMGRGIRKSEVFPFSHRPPLSIFRLLLFLLGYPAGASAEKRGSFSLAQALNFVFKTQSFRRRIFREPNLIRIKADPNKNNNNFILRRHKELKELES